MAKSNQNNRIEWKLFNEHEDESQSKRKFSIELGHYYGVPHGSFLKSMPKSVAEWLASRSTWLTYIGPG